MPALPDANKVIRTDMHFTIGEDLFAKCRFFMFFSGVNPTVPQLNALAADVFVWFAADLAPHMSTDRALVEVVITDLSSSSGAVGSATGSSAGTSGGFALPASMCALQHNIIPRRFRGGHPRIYWPAGTQADTHDAQTWSSTFVAAFLAGLSSFYGSMTATGWSGYGSLQLCNVSYYLGNVVHTGTTGRARNVSQVRPLPVIDLVTETTVPAGIASQRKRLLRLA